MRHYRIHISTSKWKPLSWRSRLRHSNDVLWTELTSCSAAKQVGCKRQGLVERIRGDLPKTLLLCPLDDPFRSAFNQIILGHGAATNASQCAIKLKRLSWAALFYQSLPWGGGECAPSFSVETKLLATNTALTNSGVAPMVSAREMTVGSARSRSRSMKPAVILLTIHPHKGCQNPCSNRPQVPCCVGSSGWK